MDRLIIHEVGLRDGLQMEKETVPFEKKVDWINSLIDTGIDIIQLGSFVHPVKMPQMADTDALFRYFTQEHTKPLNVEFSGLVLNEKGLERGLACGVDFFCMGVSASETHSKKNTGMTVDNATERIINIAKQAVLLNKKVQVSIQSAFGCGFEGAIALDKVLGIVRKYLDAGLTRISLADTAGHANPLSVEMMISRIKEMSQETEITCHFHNTYGMGLASCVTAMNYGAVSFETAFGGLGGCPFTKLSAGNVCTEDFVHMINKMGFRKDINLNALIDIAKNVSQYFDRELPGFVYKAGAIKY